MLRESKGVYIEANCSNCGLNAGSFCMGYGRRKDGSDTYGEDITKMSKEFPNGCDDWEVSFDNIEHWMSDGNKQVRYDIAVNLYSFLIEYAKERKIDSIDDLKGAIQGDTSLHKYEKETYIARLDNISDNVKVIFSNRGIDPYEELKKIEDEV